tara:strand:- start:336 stop:620 length:285 start_codon:yes stop_codon:yes gene_type:complete
MPTRLSTDKNECLLDLFIALANRQIVCIVIDNECHYDLGYEGNYQILYNILNNPIKSIEKTTKSDNEYRVIINKDCDDETLIEYEDDFMYAIKE